MKRFDEDGYLIGLDVGGTKVEAIAVNQNLEIMASARLLMDASSEAQAVESIAAAIQAVQDQLPSAAGKLLAIGAGVPGQVQGGEVKLAVNLNMRSYPLGSELFARFRAPFIMENDVRTAALGAFYHLRQSHAIESLAYLSVGTGIAAGLILNGKLYRGANGMAGEIGHMVFEPGGPRCNCGAYGCLEALASGPALAQQASLALQSGRKSSLAGVQPITSEAVYRAAEEGDPLAIEIIQKGGAHLARAVHWLVMAYDVEKIVIGGGVSHAGGAFLAPIQTELAQLRTQSGLARSLLPAEKILLLPVTYNAGGWGAIALARQSIGTPVSELFE